MFSEGQKYFAIFFVVVFALFLVWTYRKDIPLHKTFYKGWFWVLIGFLVFIGLIISLKFI